jgi:Ca2+-binding EF-hand superfamily protein
MTIPSLFRRLRHLPQQENIFVSHRPLHIFIAGFAAISVAPVANAQASTPAAQAAQARAPHPVTRTDFTRGLDDSFKKVDANGDGAITQSEIQAAQARSEQAVDAMLAKRRSDTFAKLDTNKDGVLSPAEFNAAMPIGNRPHADAAQALAKLDTNKDKKVSAAEFRAPPLANFDKMDLNHDGTISVDEQKKAQTAQKRRAQDIRRMAEHGAPSSTAMPVAWRAART